MSTANLLTADHLTKSPIPTNPDNTKLSATKDKPFADKKFLLASPSPSSGDRAKQFFAASPSVAALNGASDVDDLVRKIVDEVRALIEEPLDRTFATELQQRVHNIWVIN